MYEEEMILGPLTLKQAIALFCGIGCVYLIYRYIPEYSIFATILIFLITVAVMVRLKPEPIEDPETYFRKHPEKLLQKIAEVESQIHYRAGRGKSEDPMLQAALANLAKLKEAAQRDDNRNDI